MTDGSSPANDNGRPAPEAKARSCPICGRPSRSETRPFCSKRCADIDLHRWLGGNYRIAAADDADESGTGETPED